MVSIPETTNEPIAKFQSITPIEIYEQKYRIVPFLPNETVVIMEKLDGANASFRRPENGQLLRYSKQQLLSEDNDLRNFYSLMESTLEQKELNPNYRYYGEWLVAHKVRYDKEYVNAFHLYDVQDVRTGHYLPHEDVLRIAHALDFRHAPVFFYGRLPATQSEVDALIQSYIGKSHLNASLYHKKEGEIFTGEGIVVRNLSRSRADGKRIIVKYVVPEMAESRWHREYKEPKNIPENEFVVAHVTANRIEKILMKFVDEGLLSEDWSLQEARPLLPLLTKRVVLDVLEEHAVPEELEDDVIVKLIKKRTGSLAYPLLLEHQTQLKQEVI